MLQFMAKRLLVLIPTFFGISIVIFLLINTTPGDPYSSMMDPNITQADKEAMLHRIGYYDPLPLKYAKWLLRAIQGDLGYSLHYKQPVTRIIAIKMSNTLSLSIAALFLSIIISIPLGVISATKQYSVFDYAATVLAFIGVSIPSFFLALGCIKILSFDLGIFPISGSESIASGYTGLKRFLDAAYHAVLPVGVLTVMQTASLMRYTRSAMLEVIQQDYIRTARAKGLSQTIVVYKHALRNAMVTVTTLITISLGRLLSGAVLTETVFSWPGMGTLMYQAIGNRDYPLITACALLLSICVLGSNFLADIIYAVIDPRIRYN